MWQFSGFWPWLSRLACCALPWLVWPWPVLPALPWPTPATTTTTTTTTTAAAAQPPPAAEGGRLLLLLLDQAKARQARQAKARPSQGTTSKPAKPRQAGRWVLPGPWAGEGGATHHPTLGPYRAPGAPGPPLGRCAVVSTSGAIYTLAGGAEPPQPNLYVLSWLACLLCLALAWFGLGLSCLPCLGLVQQQ